MHADYVIKSMIRSLCLGLIGGLLLHGAMGTTDQVVDRVEQHYNKARTLSLNFVEDYSVDGRPRLPETGKLTLRKQGKMRWDYSKPVGKVFVSDGKSVYLYTAGDNRVEKVPLKDTEDMRAPLAFLLGRLDLKKEFRGFTVRAQGELCWLEAAPKSERVPYRAIAMLVEQSGEVRSLKITGRDGSELEFGFSQEQMNPVIDDAMFHFVVPKGAEVVNAVEYTGEK